MRVAFISFHCRYHYQSIAGRFLQAAAIKSMPDIEWRTFDLLTSSPISTALSKLLEYKPDVVAFSSYLWSFETHVRLSKRLKLVLPNAVRVLGGPDSWLALEETDRDLLCPFDAIVVGEAEYEFPRLLGNIMRNEEWERIIQAGQIADLDALSSPYQMGFFCTDTPFLHMETSRGCANHCAFCTSSRSSTRRYSIDRWRDDLGAVLNRFESLERINLLDRSLNEQTERMVAVIDCFLEKTNKQTLHIEMHPDFTDDDQLKYLKSLPANRLHVEMGIQSLCQETLSSVGRRSEPKHVERIVKTVAGFESVSLHVDLIAGLPKQRSQDIRDSVEILCSLQPEDIQLERLKLLPGTPLRRIAGNTIIYAPTPPWEVLKTDLYSAKELDESERLSQLLDRYYNSPYFSRTLRRMAFELGGWSRLWDLLGENDDGENPTSVDQRFQYVNAIMIEHGLSSRVREQWMFDLFLHGCNRSASQTAKTPEYNHLLAAISKTHNFKGRGHIERFEAPVEDLPDEVFPGLIFFLYQPKHVLIFSVDEGANPIKTDLIAVATKGKLEPV
jgi:radical SAM superfamily enzyme YgiQ (UPF0313 family)